MAGNMVLGEGALGTNDPVTLYFISNLNFHQHSLPLIPHIIISRLFGGNHKSYLNR